MSWEAIAGFSTAVIALCAFVLTIWQGCVMRRHNRLSVRPYLTTWLHSDTAKHIYAIALLNNGLGPALIKSFRLEVDGRVMIGEGMEPIDKGLKILFSQYQYHRSGSFVAKGYMMPAKVSHNLATVQFFGEKVPTPEEVDHAFKKRGKLLIEYESIYKEKWTLDSSKEGL